jgi:hypothetical protein
LSLRESNHCEEDVTWLAWLAGPVIAWGEDFRGCGCYLQPLGDPQRINLTGILKYKNKARAVIRGVASDTGRARLTTDRVLLRGWSVTIFISLGRYEISGVVIRICKTKRKADY